MGNHDKPGAPRWKAYRTRQIISLLQAVMFLLGVQTTSPYAFAHDNPPNQAGAVGVTEHLGSSLPPDLVFRDETGKEIRLGDLITGPTIILPVYYRCTNVCFVLQGRVAGALRSLGGRPAEDYRVISVSFDENETPEMASRSKQTYLGAMKTPFPAEGWRFLTGDATNIRRLTDAVGFGFQRQQQDFAHPVVSIVVNGNGTVVRYLYGVSVLPKDLALAITEAKSGVSGASIRKLMEFCFSYDPTAKTYVFNLLRVSATVVILCAGSFLAFLLLTGKKRKETPAGEQ